MINDKAKQLVILRCIRDKRDKFQTIPFWLLHLKVRVPQDEIWLLRNIVLPLILIKFIIGFLTVGFQCLNDLLLWQIQRTKKESFSFYSIASFCLERLSKDECWLKLFTERKLSNIAGRFLENSHDRRLWHSMNWNN